MTVKHRGNNAAVAQCSAITEAIPLLGAKVSNVFANCIEFAAPGYFLTVGDGVCTLANDTAGTPLRKFFKGDALSIAKDVARWVK